MTKLSFVHKKHLSDETDTYSVVPSVDKPTLGEVLEAISEVDKKAHEFGDVEVFRNGKQFLYRNRKEGFDISEEEREFRVNDMFANGGWGRMDYLIHCEVRE